MKRLSIFILAMTALTMFNAQAVTDKPGIRIKELCRLGDARDNSLVGYGLVTGLAGTGDSTRSKATLQSISNILRGFGVIVLPDQVRSRNAASVMITATLPAYAQPGDKLDVNVTSLGDARSLLGGTLLLSHLTGPDGKVYALAQGPVSVGGFKYDLNGNVVQKNHPTAASIPNGAMVERSVRASLMSDDGSFQYILHQPDFTTAGRIAEAVNRTFQRSIAHAEDASRVRIVVPERDRADLVGFITRLEAITVQPDRYARIVVNERTGTVVSGGDVTISKVSITHGDLKVTISTEYVVSQPFFVRETGSGVRTAVVPNTTIEATEDLPQSVALPDNTSVTDLVAALNRVKATSRDIITILQAMKRAGALHAELIIQ